MCIRDINLYISEKGKKFILVATYGGTIDASQSYEFGEGHIGEAAESKNTIHTLFKSDHAMISTGLGSNDKTHLLIIQLIANGDVIGVLEFCSISPIAPIKINFLETLSENIAHSINILMKRS